MTLRDYLNIIRERKALIAATIIVVTLTSVLFSFRQVPQYSATTRLRVRPVGAGSEVAQVLQSLLNNQTGILTEAELVRSSDVAKRVAGRLKLPDQPEALLQSIQVSVVPATEVLLITASALTPQHAVNLADAFAEEYIASRRDQAIDEATRLVQKVSERLEEATGRLEVIDRRLARARPGTVEFALLTRDRDNVTALVSSLQSQQAALLDRGPLSTGAGEIIQRAPLPETQSSPNHVRNAVLGLLVSAPLAIGLTLLRDSLNDTVKTKEEAEHLTGTQALALVPHDSDLEDSDAPPIACRDDPASMVAEAYRTLRVNLEFPGNGERARYALITSPSRTEGKSITAANLALAFAEAGRRTVLVSADLRRPSLHRYLGTTIAPGLSEALSGSGRPESWMHAAAPNLWLVPSGSSSLAPDARLTRKHLETLFGRGPIASNGRNGAARARPAAKTNGNGRATRATDMVLIDTPPILRASEVPALAASVDGVVLVLRQGVTRRSAASRAAEQVRRVGGHILGVVLIGVQPEEGYGPAELSRGRTAELVTRAWDRVLEALRR